MYTRERFSFRRHTIPVSSSADGLILSCLVLAPNRFTEPVLMLDWSQDSGGIDIEGTTVTIHDSSFFRNTAVCDVTTLVSRTTMLLSSQRHKYVLLLIICGSVVWRVEWLVSVWGWDGGSSAACKCPRVCMFDRCVYVL